MGFLDKAKALADQAAAKVDEAVNTATSSQGAKQADPYLRDLGVLAYLQESGRSPADAKEQRERCLAAIHAAESQGAINLAMSSVAPPPPSVPPPPGAAAQTQAPPPPPGGVAPPPPPGGVAPPHPPGGVAPPPPPGAV